MKLAETIATMARLVSGRLPAGEAARALGAPIEGIALYAKMARNARRALLDGMFPHCRHAIVERSGEAGWHAVVEAYFEAHPELRFVRHANAAAVPAFLAALPAAAPWLAELADFEWNEWATEIAARADGDDAPDTGPLRVTSTLSLRRYAHDVVSWVDSDGRQGQPAARTIHVAFWQDREAISFRNALSEAHVAALAAILEGSRPEQEALGELRGADLVLGARVELDGSTS